MPSVLPCLIPPAERSPTERFGDLLLDAYLEFLSGRCQPNSGLAARFDLKVFFTIVAKPVQAVTVTDVLGFMTAQRSGASRLPDPLLAPVDDARVGVSLRTVCRRLSTIAGLYAFLTTRGDVPADPVARGPPTRRERHRPTQGVPRVRAPRRTLPRILTPVQVDALTTALRTHRARAMVAARLLGGLRGARSSGCARKMSVPRSAGCSSRGQGRPRTTRADLLEFLRTPGRLP